MTEAVVRDARTELPPAPDADTGDAAPWPVPLYVRTWWARPARLMCITDVGRRVGVWQLRVATSFLDHFPHAMLLGPSLEPLQEAVHVAHAAVRTARRPAD